MNTPSLPLRAPRHSVDRRAIVQWTAHAVGGWSPLIAAQAVVLLLHSAPWQTALLVATSTVALAHILVMPRWRYRVHRWEVTDEAVVTLQGWLTRQWAIVPISRIQGVRLHRGPLQQLLGLSTVVVTTASGATSLIVPDLADDAAAELTRELTSLTQATPGDAT